MTPPRQRLVNILDRAIGGLIVALVLGSSLAFGGAAWWGPIAIAALTTLLGTAAVARATISGRWTLLKSPLTAIGILGLAIAIVQLVPLPASLAGRLSPKARAAYSAGLAPNATKADPGSAEKSPASLDRPATLRWLAGAGAALVVFCVSAHYCDRLSRSMLVWGSLSAAFSACSVLGLAQLLADSGGFFGAIEPGSGFPGAPSLADLAEVPGSTAALRLVGDPRRSRPPWPVSKPDRLFQIGSLPGGPSAFLALASIGLPLSLGIALQSLAPRGSREPLKARLRESNRGGLAILLGGSAILGAGLVGYLSGSILAIPFALGLAIAGLPSARGTGLRWAAPGLTGLAILALSGGVVIGDRLGRPPGSPTLSLPGGLKTTRVAWAEASRLARDFPLIGSGLGSFGAVWPYYKSVDRGSTGPESGLLQWWAEAGWAGLAIVSIAGLWTLIRVPGAIRRVGSADRALAFGMLGSAVSAGALWVGLGLSGPWSLAVGVCAFGGPWNRWLAGGTDLFVESD